jgi:hypothetical protein
MNGDFRKDPSDGSGPSPPSEAWLFSQAIQGKPIPRIISPEAQARAKRDELEQLAQFSSRHAEELRRLQAADAEARRDRELLEWSAQISTECESKLRTLLWEEAESREAWRRAEQFAETLLESNWDPIKHPHLGGPPNRGWWAKTGGSGGAQSPPSAATPFRTAAYRADQSTARIVTVSDKGTTKGSERLFNSSDPFY